MTVQNKAVSICLYCSLISNYEILLGWGRGWCLWMHVCWSSSFFLFLFFLMSGQRNSPSSSSILSKTEMVNLTWTNPQEYPTLFKQPQSLMFIAFTAPTCHMSCAIHTLELPASTTSSHDSWVAFGHSSVYCTAFLPIHLVLYIPH